MQHTQGTNLGEEQLGREIITNVLTTNWRGERLSLTVVGHAALGNHRLYLTTSGGLSANITVRGQPPEGNGFVDIGKEALAIDSGGLSLSIFGYFRAYELTSDVTFADDVSIIISSVEGLQSTTISSVVFDGEPQSKVLENHAPFSGHQISLIADDAGIYTVRGLPVQASEFVSLGELPANKVMWVVGAYRAFMVDADIAGSLQCVVTSYGTVGFDNLQDSQALSYRSVSIDTQALETDETILVDASSAPVTITLMVAGQVPGKVLHIKKTDSSANAVILAGNGTETIDGSNTQSMLSQYDSARIMSDSAEWWVQ